MSLAEIVAMEALASIVVEALRLSGLLGRNA
jgi:hypothetical protein